MKEQTELRIYVHKTKTLLDMYINSIIAGDIKNLTIKEEWFMLEKLKEQREIYAAELDKLKNTNLEEIKNARFEYVKEQIANEVKNELDVKISEVELKIAHYDFVIANEEDKATTELEENQYNEDMEG